MLKSNSMESTRDAPPPFPEGGAVPPPIPGGSLPPLPPLPRPLNATRSDPETWLGITSPSGTAVNSMLAGSLAVLCTVIFFGVTAALPESYFRDIFLERGPTQFFTVLLGTWCGFILIIKRIKLSIQAEALKYPVMPEDPDFILSSATAEQVIRNIEALSDDPERYIVLNRILIALENLKNLGRVGDVDEVLDSVAQRDESAHETSFSMISGFLWAIPVLGFIGTVLGLASAIGNFSDLLDSEKELSTIIGSLKSVTGGLSTAFETTLLALVVALIIQLWMTVQKKAEEEFLDKSQEYCLKSVVSKIRSI
jgi:biopolymer transport protein ExbB/TolQ